MMRIKRPVPVDPWDALRDEAQRRWGRVTAYRLGLLVGETAIHPVCSDTVESPYPRSSSAHRQFQSGFIIGRTAEVHI